MARAVGVRKSGWSPTRPGPTGGRAASMQHVRVRIRNTHRITRSEDEPKCPLTGVKERAGRAVPAGSKSSAGNGSGVPCVPPLPCLRPYNPCLEDTERFDCDPGNTLASPRTWARDGPQGTVHSAPICHQRRAGRA